MTFYADIMQNNSNNQRVLFSSIRKMLNLHATKKLPSYDSARDLAGVFVDFFNDKVRAIRNSFSSTVVSYRKKKLTFFYRAWWVLSNIYSWTPASSQDHVWEILYFGYHSWRLNERRCSRPFKVTRPSFFGGGIPSYFEALWYPHLHFYGKSNT